MKMKILVSVLFLSANCFAGDGYRRMAKMTLGMDSFGSGILSKEVVALGSDVLERCKSDPKFLSELVGDCKKQALDGNNISALALAIYLHGVDQKKGEQLLLDLANLSDSDAMILLAEFYCNNDQETALKWLEKAADLGDLDAVEILLSKYADALPEQLVVQHAKKLVADGRAIGYLPLSVAYLSGSGVEASREDALICMNKAWEAGIAEAGLMLALFYKDEDQALSLSWMEKGAKAGDSVAQYEWSQVLMGGVYTDKRIEEGLIWLQKSADANYSPALFKIGMLYKKGLYVAQSDKQALVYFLEAAEQGDSDAQYWVGLFYLSQRDKKNAYSWMKKSNEQGNTNAISVLKIIDGL